MSRAVLAVMAGLLCSLWGVKHAAFLKAEASRLTRWIHVLNHLTLIIREGTLSIPRALCAAADGPHAPDKLLRNIAGALQASPLLTLPEAYRQSSPSAPEVELLERMFTRLSHGTKESRLLALEQAASEMKLLAEEASARAAKDIKLWQTLGFTGGICLTILLL